MYAVDRENANPSLSQAPMSPLGKVLRMYPNGSAPSDNPFYGNPAWYNLTYTYGHRNMFGLAFHPITGRVYVTENGPNCNDEVNLLTAGSNYGWGPTAACGSLPPPSDTNRDGPNPVLPIWWWGTTICPTNAAIYRGPSFPTWQGDLFMGDCNTGRFHRLDLVPPNYDFVASDTILWTAPLAIIEVEAGPDGAIWLTTPTTIYRYWDSGKPPIASFTANPNPALVAATVTFDGSSSSDPDGAIVSYAWDFGDSTGGSEAMTTHAYPTFGTFNVTLTVTDNESFTATAYRDVHRHRVGSRRGRAVLHVASRWHRCGRKLERAEFRVGGPRHSHRERHRVRWLPCRLARVDSNRRGKRTFPPRHVLAVPRFRRRRHRGGLPHLVRAAEAEARRAPSLSESRKSLAGQVRSGNILYVGGADGACMTTVLLQTTMGDVKIELLDETMPTGNF